MTKKLWGGRFETGLDQDAETLSYSLHIDKRLVQYDLQVNRAHACALKKASVFSDEEFLKIETEINRLSVAFEADENGLLGHDEDIHSCIERLLTERLGDLGKKLHTGKSRNDQVITDVRLFMKAELQVCMMLMDDLLYALWSLADQHKALIFPGFTHLQPAQPVLFGHHILAYFEKFSKIGRAHV